MSTEARGAFGRATVDHSEVAQVEISRAVDLAHAARANQADDFVCPEASTAGNRHALSEGLTDGRPVVGILIPDPVERSGRQ